MALIPFRGTVFVCLLGQDVSGLFVNGMMIFCRGTCCAKSHISDNKFSYWSIYVLDFHVNVHQNLHSNHLQYMNKKSMLLLPLMFAILLHYLRANVQD